ncbi:hypothetical protein QSG27_10200 [Azospirillum sp. C340-1]|uniref:DUF1217 domain-containing protein n=1 Tax=Azospirillum isscasi TaxID=3053926 RepID=A0ABU0WFS5_9PROT|nr:hypothetical protein [Azospirillum isscasi]
MSDTTSISSPLAGSFGTSRSSATAKTQAVSGGRAATEDSVSLSELGKSLRGESLAAFEALSDKQRSQLVSLVDSGKISGEEVHDALTQRLKQARSSAVAATARMFNNDHATLLRNDATSADDLRNALGSTLTQRSSLMDKLASAMSEGDLAATSDTLAARSLNPLLSADRSGMSRLVMPGFFGMDFTDSRLNYTRKEGDAAYKLKSLGVDFDGIDNALRGIGEKDAAAILAERAGLPSSRKVAKNSEFSLEDAVFKPLTAGSGQAAEPSFEGQADRLRAFFQNAISPGGGVQRVDIPPEFSTSALRAAAVGGAQANVDRDYVRGLLPRY